MRIISKSTLKNYWEKHKDVEGALLSWFKIVKQSHWKDFTELKYQFGTCKILGNDRVIFKIKGNQYRVVIKITFVNQIIWIRFIGTHEEYDKIDAKTI